MKGQNMPNFAELVFADSMSRGDFAELNFADTKYKIFFHALHIFFSNIKLTIFPFINNKLTIKYLNIVFQKIINNIKNILTQPAITCSKLTIETLEQGVEYAQS